MKFRARISYGTGMGRQEEDHEFEAINPTKAAGILSQEALTNRWQVLRFERYIPIPVPADLK